MIDVSELLTDPDMACKFRVKRFGGSFDNEGEFSHEHQSSLVLTGVVHPSKVGEKVKFQPEGDRQNALITVYCTRQLRKANGTTVQSDIITHCGADYKVIECVPWVHHGYWKALAEQI